MSDRSKAKISDLCVADVVHEDVRLDACQSGGKTGLVLITYSFEVAVNYIAGVEKVKAFSDIK